MNDRYSSTANAWEYEDYGLTGANQFDANGNWIAGTIPVVGSGSALAVEFRPPHLRPDKTYFTCEYCGRAYPTYKQIASTSWQEIPDCPGCGAPRRAR